MISRAEGETNHSKRRYITRLLTSKRSLDYCHVSTNRHLKRVCILPPENYFIPNGIDKLYINNIFTGWLGWAVLQVAVTYIFTYDRTCPGVVNLRNPELRNTDGTPELRNPELRNSGIG